MLGQTNVQTPPVAPSVASPQSVSLSFEGWPQSALSEVLIGKALPLSTIEMEVGKDFEGFNTDGSLKANFTSPTAESKKVPYPFVSFMADGVQYRIYGNTVKNLFAVAKFVEIPNNKIQTSVSISADGNVAYGG